MSSHVARLEPRVLLTTARFYDANVLAIEGTAGDDQITVTIDANAGQVVIQTVGQPEIRVFVNHSPRKPAHNVHRIRVDGFGGNDTLIANLGIPVGMSGGGGDDTLESSSLNFEVLGGFGNDTLRATNAAATYTYVSGDQGHDTLDASAVLGGRVVADGGGGRDLIRLGGGDDFAWGGPNSDTIVGNAGDDVLVAGRGDDLCYGDAITNGPSGGDDWIFGMDGSDTLAGGAGVDHLFGQSGADDLHGDDGADFLFGGGGNDTLVSDAGDTFRYREYRRYERLLYDLIPAEVRPIFNG